MERIISGSLYAEDPLGLYVVRGENVVLLGDVDGADDPPSVLQKVVTLLLFSFGYRHVHQHGEKLLGRMHCTAINFCDNLEPLQSYVEQGMVCRCQSETSGKHSELRRSRRR